MRKKKLTPQQAFDLLKQLMPGLEVIHKAVAGQAVNCQGQASTGRFSTGFPCDTIDWSTHQKWPEEKGDWRQPMLPADAGKRARFRDALDEAWQEGELCGYDNRQSGYCWMNESATGWQFCEVFDPAPAKTGRRVKNAWQGPGVYTRKNSPSGLT